MLELRPTCENCGTALPPDAANARICTFECTFCAECVDGPLQGVCPNCTGGFTPRPIRPPKGLERHPATEVVTERPVDLEAHSRLIRSLGELPSDER